jgi:hypothetical protein
MICKFRESGARRWDNRGEQRGDPEQNYKLSLIAFRITSMNEKEVRN